MDSKRDHRGGHRNIYDQIDLEIINSKGPGPDKIDVPKREQNLYRISRNFEKIKIVPSPKNPCN